MPARSEGEREGQRNLKFNLMVSAECPTHISFTQGADDMSEHDEWASYSHWGMFLTAGKHSK
jgi:hypothetical protein